MPPTLKKHLATLGAHAPEMRNAYKVKRLGIFGSTARGTARRTSDVDVLVEFSKTPGLFKFVELEERLAQLLRRRVDLVTKDSLKPALKVAILKDVVYVDSKRSSLPRRHR